MARNLNLLFLYLAFTAFWMLIFVYLGFVVVWAFFYHREHVDKKRPGINIKEFL